MGSNNRDLDFVETAVADNRLYLKAGGNVGIGTNSPVAKLDVNGDMNVAQNITYGGTLFMGLQVVQTNIDMQGNSHGSIICTCPVSTRLIGGGGGHRDDNDAADDIIIHSNGPFPGYDNSTWRLIITNTSADARAIRVNAICARVQ
jgi:hypothetical protein